MGGSSGTYSYAMLHQLILLLTLQASAQGADAGKPLRPLKAIIMLIADDYGWWNIDMPEHNNVSARTPHLHQLADEGVRLDRHYVYKYCSPTRSSLLTGRLPIHVNQNNEANSLLSASGADIRMTTIAQKLKQADPPFQTHFFGKWHCGARSPANLPINRGFDTHLGFLKGMEDHFDQKSDFNGYAKRYIDLWKDDGPADNTLNGTYSVFRDAEHAVQIISQYDASKDPPLYLHVTFQTCHSPYEVPAQYLDRSIDNQCQRAYQGMATVMDEGIGNITAALKSKALWEDTLIIFSADNGAPTEAGECGNNYPLRGGKSSDFEGGVRVAAVMSGGYVPAMVRGSVHRGLLHIADWYATLSTLVGVDPMDTAKGVPPVDGVDQWESLMTPNATTSARTEVPLSFCTNIGGQVDDCVSSTHGILNVSAYDQGALITDGGKWKIIIGNQHGLGFFTGPSHPNGTLDYKDSGCPQGCLFDLETDPTEHVDLKDQMPDVFGRLKARLEQIGKTVWQTNYTDAPYAYQCLSPEEAASRYDGHIGPQCFPGAIRFV